MAITGRPGPVYLGLPHEVLYEKSDETLFDTPQMEFPENPEISENNVDSILREIDNALDR